MYYSYFETPAGTVLFTGNSTSITGIYWKVFARTPAVLPGWVEDKTVFQVAARQLEEYFEGKRTEFNFAYAASGTAFQKSVWSELAKIPYGTLSSYKAIAVAIGKPKAVRAVGTAVGSNPISIVVPCHRVLASSGKLGGYAGGLESKIKLLQLENISWTPDVVINR